MSNLFSSQQSAVIQNPTNLQFLKTSAASSHLIRENTIHSVSTPEVASQSVLMAIKAAAVTMETTLNSRQSAAGAWGEIVLWVSK